MYKNVKVKNVRHLDIELVEKPFPVTLPRNKRNSILPSAVIKRFALEERRKLTFEYLKKRLMNKDKCS